MKRAPFGSIVKRERERQGLGLTEAALRCGVSRQYLHLLEGGSTSPSIENADAVLKGLGLSAVIGVLNRRKRIDIGF